MSSQVSQQSPLLELVSVSKDFAVTRGRIMRRGVANVSAVDDVSLRIFPGENVGLVGESGCGKSTVARIILGLLRPTSGQVWFEGTEISKLSGKEMRRVRRHMQLIFQDPYGSLDPRMRVGAIIREPLAVYEVGASQEQERRVDELLETVGLSSAHRHRLPAELSGGERQRVGIARALALQPRLIVCDEPVSSLDVSIRAQIVNLLEDLQRRFGLTYIFISHDLSVVKHICHRIAVMYLGRIVELGTKAEIFKAPSHPYTEALLSAIPIPDPRKERLRRRIVLSGEQPDATNRPSGCHFHPRCNIAQAQCRVEYPPALAVSEDHYARCYFAAPFPTSQVAAAVPTIEQRIDA
jgi:oligopeptide/dipeptide ABC transporter ATP-binding protein